MYKYDNTCTIFYSKTSFKIIKYVLNGQKTIIIELYSCELNAVDFKCRYNVIQFFSVENRF